MKPKRMIFDLTDDDREALERIRVELGARSHAEALRLLIRKGGAPDDPPAPVRPKLTPAPAKPAPKAEFKSRLKGQWKAP
jgi:hypothetical protein